MCAATAAQGRRNTTPPWFCPRVEYLQKHSEAGHPDIGTQKRETVSNHWVRLPSQRQHKQPHEAGTCLSRPCHGRSTGSMHRDLSRECAAAIHRGLRICFGDYRAHRSGGAAEGMSSDLHACMLQLVDAHRRARLSSSRTTAKSAGSWNRSRTSPTTLVSASSISSASQPVRFQARSLIQFSAYLRALRRQP